MNKEQILDFIEGNVWFMVAGVVLIFALIGYLVEKNRENIQKRKAGCCFFRC